jgi:type VI secretion system protein ImpK
MREEIAKLVYPIFTYALHVKDELARGDAPSMQKVQAELKGLLKSESEARRWPDYTGDAAVTESRISSRSGGSSFLGIRYALVCWLDEIFIMDPDSPWRDEWNDKCLEIELYSHRERAFRYWTQAQLAEARPGTDALEVFFLCVVLGFRGEKRDQPEQLRSWLDSVKSQLAQGQQREWPGPIELQPPINVPPLTGQQRLQKMVLTVGLSLLVLIPVVMFFLVLRSAG